MRLLTDHRKSAQSYTPIPFLCNAFRIICLAFLPIRCRMAISKNVTFRISPKQELRLWKLQEKMALDRSAVINYAIKLLADSQGVK